MAAESRDDLNERLLHDRRLHESELVMQRRPATVPENVITRWECQRCGTGWIDAGTTVMCQADFTVCGAHAARTYVAVDVLHEWARDQRLLDHTGHPADVAHESLLDDLSALLDDLTTGGKTDAI